MILKRTTTKKKTPSLSISFYDELLVRINTLRRKGTLAGQRGGRGAHRAHKQELFLMKKICPPPLHYLTRGGEGQVFGNGLGAGGVSCYRTHKGKLDVKLDQGGSRSDLYHTYVCISYL